MYSFSLLSFLSFIESCKPYITYEIKASKANKLDSTWMDDIPSSEIQKRFNDHEWNINKSKRKRGDLLTICKMT